MTDNHSNISSVMKATAAKGLPPDYVETETATDNAHALRIAEKQLKLSGAAKPRKKNDAAKPRKKKKK